MSSLEEIPILSEEEAQALASPSLEEREAEKLALVEAELNALEEQRGIQRCLCSIFDY